MPTLLQIDAFADRPFSGNPAAVCLLDAPADAGWMQNVAGEMNLSETAFVHPVDGGFGLRWFTPAVEVELCGHATLASAHALWSEGRASKQETIRFNTASGWLSAKSTNAPGLEMIELDFPSTPAEACDTPPGLAQALGVSPVWLGRNKFDLLMAVADESELKGLSPDFVAIAELTARGVIVTTACGTGEFDFLSRYFAPAAGINEDPVTGSAHCTLVPYWAKRLGKTKMTGYQCSVRGGVVGAQLLDERVCLQGQAITVMRGELIV